MNYRDFFGCRATSNAMKAAWADAQIDDDDNSASMLELARYRIARLKAFLDLIFHVNHPKLADKQI